MPNGECLHISVDLKQWMNMPEKDRLEHTFYALRYLVNESQKSKLMDRLITFAGSFLAGLAVMAPMVWWMITK